MEKILPKYMKHQNRVKMVMPLAESSRLSAFDHVNRVHFITVQSDDYEFKHVFVTANKAIASIDAIPCSIFTN